MTNENVKRRGFVLKDQNGNYVSSGSIYYYPETKRICYSYSRFITNGFTHPTKKMAEVELDKLNQLQARFQLPKQFRIEEIADMNEVLLMGKSAEVKLGLSSIVIEYIDFSDSKRFVWVVKDDQNNFCHDKSFQRIEAETMFISYKYFSPECWGYIDLLQAELVSDVLKWEAEKMRLNDTTFHLEYVDLREAIKQYKAFNGENMVLVTAKKQVA